MSRSLLLALVLFIFTGGIINAQGVKKTPKNMNQTTPLRNCGTMDYNAQLEAADPSLIEMRIQLEKFTQEYMATHQHDMNKAVITIPVVFHIVWKTTAQNVSDARVQEALGHLNRDFAGLNPHSMGTFPTSLKANTEFQFCLAQRTPAGVATNGINRVQTTTTQFIDDDKVKSTSTGGANAWDVTKYLNIWVCNLGNGLCGYGQFPYANMGGGVNNTYGLVIMYQYFGATGAVSPYNNGGTSTHEIGHCFNLLHTWGDDGGACSGNSTAFNGDLIADTPDEADANYADHTGQWGDGCSASVLYQDFMDYTNDASYACFTPNQSTRMRACFAQGGPLYSLTTSNGCTPVTTGTLATLTTTAVSAIANTTATSGGNITNQGSAAVTARGVCWSTTSGPVATGLHTTDGAGTGIFTSNITGLTAGTTYYVRAYATSTAGTAYGNQVSFTTTGGTIPTCDTTNLMTSGDYWYSYANGNNSYADKAKANYFATTTTGKSIQDVYIQFILAKGTGNATVSIWNNSGAGGSPGAAALGSKTVPVSTIIADVNNQVMTAVHFTSPINLTGPCYVGVTLPTAAGDTVVLLADTSSSTTYNVAWEKWSDNVWYAYDNTNSWGIEAALAIFPVICSTTTEIPAEYSDNMDIKIYPNPSQNYVYCELGKLSTSKVRLTVFNLLGKQISVSDVADPSGKIKLDFSAQANGIYFIQIDSQEGKFIRKVSINK